MEQTAISGPRLAPQSGKTRQLVIFLHGYGANGDDLIDIGQHWGSLLPDTEFVSPHAPFPCPGAPMGREWFALSNLNNQELWQGVNAAAPFLNAFIDAEIQRTGLTESEIALVGFSQGTMMALHTGLRRSSALAAIIGFSGRLCLPAEGGKELLKEELRSKPPVFLAHGDSDMIVPFISMQLAKEILESLDIRCQSYVEQNMGHGISMEALQEAGKFLKQSFHS